VHHQFLRTMVLILAGATASAGCHLLSDPDASNVKSLIVAGTPPVIGESSRFAAMAVHPDGTSTTVTADATWRSSNTTVATVSSDGTVTAKNHGSVEISATYGGARGAFAFDVAVEASLTLAGTISDSATKVGIAGATVVVKDVSNNTRAATTTGTGRYSIEELPSGTLELTVRANGYTTSVQSISMTADQTVNVALTRGSECSALTFDGLRASDRFATVTACGFTVAASTPNWSVSATTGRPAPSVQFTSARGSTTVGELVVTSDAPFRFQSVDVSSSTTPVQYVITGIAKGTTAFTLQNTVSSPADFVGIANAASAPAVDALVIRLSTPPLSCCDTTIAVDNIALAR
jgi:Carboxypeptidase regulatory-like domain/Bacterial Ig-like domain (group 2)